MRIIVGVSCGLLFLPLSADAAEWTHPDGLYSVDIPEVFNQEPYPSGDERIMFPLYENLASFTPVIGCNIYVRNLETPASQGGWTLPERVLANPEPYFSGDGRTLIEVRRLETFEGREGYSGFTAVYETQFEGVRGTDLYVLSYTLIADAIQVNATCNTAGGGGAGVTDDYIEAAIALGQSFRAP